MSMRFEPEPYRKIASFPVGCFSAKLLGDWGMTIYEPEAGRPLDTLEISEFSRIIYDLMKAMPSQSAFDKFFMKYGKKIPSEGFNQVRAFNLSGQHLEYIVHGCGNVLSVFPYRRKEAST